jgi:deoxynucleoside triphosphate triphosphohydrolase SAMHD1
MFDLITSYKTIYDNIHGFIHLSNWAMELIDTKYFQRLRYLHQLGTCYYVFPSAVHTRFEHSLGTYYLVGYILDSIKKSTNRDLLNDWMSKVPELKKYYGTFPENHDKLDNYVIELVKIAGLCHDLGHGPFSHVFDDVFIKQMRGNNPIKKYDIHENRSGAILEKIISVTRLRDVLDNDAIKFIKLLISPPSDRHGFIYQIVSNSLNDIDVDKCDYICRDTYSVGLKYSFDFRTVINDIMVINNIISYPRQLYYEISCLFMTRYRLHKQVYCHKSVISSQAMINEIMVIIDPILDIYKSIDDVDKFVDLTDSYILESVKFLNKTKYLYDEQHQKRIDDAVKILNRIEQCNFYKFIGTIVTTLDTEIECDNILKIDHKLDKNKFMIYNGKIGFVSGKKDNPLDNIYFYNRKNMGTNNTKHTTIKKERVSAFLPDTYQENLIMFFVKDSNDENTVKRLTNVYNLLLEQIEIVENDEK